MIAFGPHDLTNVDVPEVEQTGASSQFYDKFSMYPLHVFTVEVLIARCFCRCSVSTALISNTIPFS